MSLKGPDSRPSLLVAAGVSVAWLVGLIGALFVLAFLGEGLVTVAAALLLPALLSAGIFRLLVAGSGGPVTLATAATFLGALAVGFIAPYLPFPLATAPLLAAGLALVATRLLDAP